MFRADNDNITAFPKKTLGKESFMRWGVLNHEIFGKTVNINSSIDEKFESLREISPTSPGFGRIDEI